MPQKLTNESPSKPAPEKAALGLEKAELSEESLAQVAGGTGANLMKACVKGEHIKEAKIT